MKLCGKPLIMMALVTVVVYSHLHLCVHIQHVHLARLLMGETVSFKLVGIFLDTYRLGWHSRATPIFASSRDILETRMSFFWKLTGAVALKNEAWPMQMYACVKRLLGFKVAISEPSAPIQEKTEAVALEEERLLGDSKRGISVDEWIKKRIQHSNAHVFANITMNVDNLAHAVLYAIPFMANFDRALTGRNIIESERKLPRGDFMSKSPYDYAYKSNERERPRRLTASFFAS
jgi:hypothetical protein